MNRYEYFQMRMEPEIAEKLRIMATLEKESRSSFLRNLIDQAFQKRYRLTDKGVEVLQEAHDGRLE